MVASVDDIILSVRSNPFIDGVGYFIEITTRNPIPYPVPKDLTRRMQEEFCPQSQVTVEGENVLGLDFHDHIYTKGDEGDDQLKALHGLLKRIEAEFGVEHLCIEFQFDLSSARKARVEVDELLQP